MQYTGGNILKDNLMKTRNMTLTIMCAIALMACNKENPRVPSEGTFSATLETPVVVKTQLGTDGKSVVWRANDEINIFAGEKNEKYTTASSGTTTATFTGNPVSADAYYALYPYDATAQLQDGKIIATLPAAQTANKNNLGNKMNVAVACSNTSALSFKNVGGLIQFEIKTKNVGEVVIKGNNNEYIAGKVSIDWNGGNPKYTVVEGKQEISLKPYGNKVFEMGKYHFVVLPQTFEKGITITMKPYSWATDAVVLKSNAPADLVKSGDSPLELTRSHIKPVGAVDEGLLWEYSGVTVNGIMGSVNTSGIYIDFNTGRTFSGIGASTYCGEIDLIFINNSGSFGMSSPSVSTATALCTNANLSKFGTPSEADLISKWNPRLITKFIWLSEMTDEQYEALKVTDDTKALYPSNPLDKYFSWTATDAVFATSDRIAEGTNKFLAFKTFTAAEDNCYGVLRFTSIDKNTGTATFDYKIGR